MIEVRQDGTVWRIAKNVKGRIVPQQPVRAECRLKSGYLGVAVRFGGRQYLVLAHRLIWTVLVGQIPPGLDINHRDGVKANNTPENLETVTRGENHRHAYKLGLKKPALAPVVQSLSQQAKALRMEGKTYQQIATALGVSQTTAYRAVTA
ncbi:HNH endonuclease [Novosphingobium sp. 28-62-57]